MRFATTLSFFPSASFVLAVVAPDASATPSAALASLYSRSASGSFDWSSPLSSVSSALAALSNDTACLTGSAAPAGFFSVAGAAAPGIGGGPFLPIAGGAFLPGAPSTTPPICPLGGGPPRAFGFGAADAPTPAVGACAGFSSFARRFVTSAFFWVMIPITFSGYDPFASAWSSSTFASVYSLTASGRASASPACAFFSLSTAARSICTAPLNGSAALAAIAAGGRWVMP